MAFLLSLILAGLISQQPETLSLLKEPLFAPPVPKKERALLQTELADAQKAAGHELTTDNALRLAHVQRELGHIGDALETLTRAAESKADAPAIRLERGRGFILIRKFDLAARELQKAVETLPQAHCDIGFALYLQADYKQSKDEFAKCKTPPMFAALAARRAGDASQAPSAPAKSVDKGDKNDLTIPYLTAVDRLLAKDVNAARDLLKPLVEKHLDRWMEPVYIAAEADYARIALPVKKKKKK